MSEEKKTTIKRDFEQKGNSFMLDLVPVDPSNPATPEKRVEVQFGHLVATKTDEDGVVVDTKVAGRFNVIWPQVVDGLEVPVVAMAVKADAAIDQVIRQARGGQASKDDYEFDLDDDFFSQKVETPKTAADDVWANDKFSDNRDRLAELANEAEQRLDTLSEARDNAQGEMLSLAHILKEVFILVGEKRKALEAWARGPANSNLTKLKKMGKGQNALYEAMKFADLSENQIAVLPNTITSGKGLDRHRGLAMTAITEDVRFGSKDDIWSEHQAGGKTKADFLPTFDGLERMLRRVAEKGLGIAEASQMSVTQLGEAFEEAVSTQYTKFATEVGKNTDTYKKDEYEYSLRVYGAVAISKLGEGLFAAAFEGMTEIAAMDDEEKQVEAYRNFTQNNLLVKRCIETAHAHSVTLKREQETKQMMTFDEEDKSPFSDRAKASFNNLAAGAAAARIYEMINKHPNADEVHKLYVQIVRQAGFDKPETDEEKEAA